MAVTPVVFCAVIDVITDMAYVPLADMAFRSAWIPAPPPESEPAMVRTCLSMIRGKERKNGRLGDVSRASTLAWGRGVVKFLTVLILGLGACSAEYQEVTIVVDEFRLSPARVDVQAGQPVHLVVRNQGRETHRFQSPLLAEHRVEVVPDAGPQVDALEQGVPLAPGQHLELMLTLPAGVYHYRCPIKGHHGMQGMIVVS